MQIFFLVLFQWASGENHSTGFFLIASLSEMSWNCSETCPQGHPGHDYRVENCNLSLETGRYRVVGGNTEPW